MKLKHLTFSSFLLLAIACLPAYAEKRIAVLPFEVLTDRADIKQFGIGTADSLTISLSQIAEFSMIDRGQINSVMKEYALQQSGFVDKKTTVKLGKLIGAQILITGSIQTFNDQFRINNKFIEVETGKVLKAKQVTGNNIFELQDRLAQEIVNDSNITLTEEIKNDIKKVTHATNNLTAYDYYIKGRNAYLEFTRDGYEKAIVFYNKALETDNKYNLVLIAKSEAQSLLVFELFRNEEEYQSLLDDAEKNLSKAKELNPDNASVYRAIASFKFNNYGDLAIAEENIMKAIKLNPQDAESYYWLYKIKNDKKYLDKSLKLNPYLVIANEEMANHYISINQYDKAKNILNKLLKINPQNINSLISFAKIENKKGHTDNVIDFYKKAIKLQPNYAYLRTNLAINYQKNKMYLEAEKELRKAVEISPNYYIAYSLLASNYYYQKKFNEAIEVSKKQVIIEPKNLHGYSFLVLLYSVTKQYDESIKECEKIIAIAPKYKDIYSKLAYNYFYKNQIDKFFFYFEKEIENYPDDIENKLTLASIYYQYGYLEKSEKIYNQIIEKNPSEAKNINIHLADIYLAQGKNTEAINKYNDTLKTDKNNAQALMGMGNANYNIEEYETAIEYYKKSLEKKSDIQAILQISSAYKKNGNNSLKESFLNQAFELANNDKNLDNITKKIYLGYIQSEKGNYTEAISIYTDLLKDYTDSSIKVELAKYYRLNKDYQSAMIKLNELLTNGENSFDIFFEIAEINSETANYNTAVEYYKKALELKPNNSEAHNKLAYIYQIQGKKELAESEYKAASSKTAVRNLFNIYWQSNNSEKLKIYLADVIKNSPNNPEYHNNLGAVYHKEGKVDQALNEYLKAVEIDPNFAIAYENIGIIYEYKMDKNKSQQYFRKACELGRLNNCNTN